MLVYIKQTNIKCIVEAVFISTRNSYSKPESMENTADLIFIVLQRYILSLNLSYSYWN